MKHYFMTLPDVVFPENRFCARCGEYLTHSNHLHARECPCLKCQQERLLTQRAPDARKSAPKNRSKNSKGSAKPARG